MRKTISITVALLLVIGIALTAVPQKKAEAMNAESAAMLGAGLVLFGGPIINSALHPYYYPPRPPVYYNRPPHVVPRLPYYGERCKEVRVLDRAGYVIDRYYRCSDY
ncbi:membrane protein [Candidatus Magnetoovum chiemensis]|nr:membrane protein [Candidatus Magnetoovum chiemensis]